MFDEGKRQNNFLFRFYSKKVLKYYVIGIVTDKNLLPITRLNFGRTQLATGLHKLGRFECFGQVAVVGMPKSCVDLWRIGHTFSGLYSVLGTEHVESVYCDFTKLSNKDSGTISLDSIRLLDSVYNLCKKGYIYFSNLIEEFYSDLIIL